MKASNVAPRKSIDHLYLRRGLINVLKFRIFLSASLICVGVVLLSSSIWASWDSIWKYCNAKAENASNKCIGAGMDAVYCADIANRTFANCINRLTNNGTTLKGGNYPTPTPRPIVVRPPTNVGNLPPPGKSPPPLGVKPIHPISAPVANQGPAPSPSPTAQTIFAKPQSTPLPRPEHHSGHHG